MSETPYILRNANGWEMTWLDGKLLCSDEEIEQISSEFLREIQPGALVGASPINRENLLGAIKSQYGYDFLVADLGYEEGSRILGQTDFVHKAIILDQVFSQTDDSILLRLPFIIGHEVGHCVLHSPYYEQLKLSGVFKEVTTDTHDALTGRKILETQRDFLEHQAHTFSASLLVPRSTLRPALIKVQKYLGINRRLGEIYINSTPSGRNDYNMTISKLSLIYGVSRTIISYRLQNLGFVADHRTKPLQIRDAVAEVLTKLGAN